MAFADILTTVMSATGRPDKEPYVTAAINPTIRRLAGLQNSYNDLFEGLEPVDKTQLVLNLTLPADFRKVAYLRPTPFMKMLDPVTPDKVVVAGKELTNCYYISGKTIIIRLRQGFQTTQLARGYYLHPPMLDISSVTTNWVTDSYEDLIVDILCAKVFMLTGDVKTAQSLELGQSGIGARIEDIKAQSRTGGVQYIQGISKVGR
jgi:hypothetical protein